VALSYYVYYRIEPRREADARARAEALLAAVAHEHGVPGRLLRKRDEPALWMEVYEGVSDAAGFEAALERACAASGIVEVLLQGSVRRTECFQTQCA
jgi:hypothetical protein